MASYPVKLKLRLDWSEMDLFGHINNVSYFKYVQASRVNYWETIGLTKLYANIGLGPMLAATSCQFLKPLHYPGNIIIQASVVEIKTTSFRIQHQILDTGHDIAAEAEDIIVMYDFKKAEKMAIPGDIRKKIEQLEGVNFRISQ
jgi:acyl-CoA thioester hydrolase